MYTPRAALRAPLAQHRAFWEMKLALHTPTSTFSFNLRVKQETWQVVRILSRPLFAFPPLLLGLPHNISLAPQPTCVGEMMKLALPPYSNLMRKLRMHGRNVMNHFVPQKVVCLVVLPSSIYNLFLILLWYTNALKK